MESMVDTGDSLGTSVKGEVGFVEPENVRQGRTKCHGVYPLPDGVLGIEFEGAVEVSHHEREFSLSLCTKSPLFYHCLDVCAWR